MNGWHISVFLIVFLGLEMREENKKIVETLGKFNFLWLSHFCASVTLNTRENWLNGDCFFWVSMDFSIRKIEVNFWNEGLEFSSQNSSTEEHRNCIKDLMDNFSPLKISKSKVFLVNLTLKTHEITKLKGLDDLFAFYTKIGENSMLWGDNWWIIESKGL